MYPKQARVYKSGSRVGSTSPVVSKVLVKVKQRG